MKHLIVGLIFLMNQPNHQYWMKIALEEAKLAAFQEEVPVGAVLVLNDQEISRGHNMPLQMHDPSAHAEIVVLRKAAIALKNYRLPGLTLYVTLEPCLMCAGAIMNSRISKVYFGASDRKTGVAGSVINAFDNTQLNHHCSIEGGVLAEECATVLKDFFKIKRLAKV
jgi:tRNA(adenine34) deaminase